ncbi:MAG: APC family permease, partial [Candidatus Limnocylindrales bacterium]
IFALPTYAFVGASLLMIGLGAFRLVVLGQGQPAQVAPPGQGVFEPLTIILLLKAFAGGSVALTGTEAIADGVQAFQPPEPKNAAQTLTAMAILLGVLFIGVTFVADGFGILPIRAPIYVTVPSQVATIVFGGGSPLYFFFQGATALTLFLAANTSFNAFPRLAAILAQDGFVPRQFAFRGDRLAFTVGIVLLGAVSAGVVALFAGDTHALIPLYSIGVFVSFTIAQAGMVRHWWRERGTGWHWRIFINAVGMALTGVVTVVVLFAKAPESLLVAVVIPILVGLMYLVHREYASQAFELEVRPSAIIGPPHRRERVVIPVPALTRAVVQAVNFGRSISDNVICVHVTDDGEAGERLRERFERQLPGVTFVLVESPFRSLVGPFVAYLDVTGTKDPEAITLVVLPEYVPRHWWDRILYNQVTNQLKRALLGRPNTVISTVPYRRES